MNRENLKVVELDTRLTGLSDEDKALILGQENINELLEQSNKKKFLVSWKGLKSVVGLELAGCKIDKTSGGNGIIWSEGRFIGLYSRLVASAADEIKEQKIFVFLI